MAKIAECFRLLVSREDLVSDHVFDSGFDDGVYYNFIFDTSRPAALWRLMQTTVFETAEHQAHLAASAMAMCSAEGGWHDYVQLRHWDPQVTVVSPDVL